MIDDLTLSVFLLNFRKQLVEYRKYPGVDVLTPGEIFGIIYLANPNGGAKMTPRDRPINKKPAYLAGFLDFFFSAFLCGSGGVPSIRRSTSSGFGGVFSCLFFMASIPERWLVEGY